MHVNASSSYLSISSLLLLSTSIPAAETPLTILSMTGYIEETLTVIRSTPSPTLTQFTQFHPNSHRHLYFHASESLAKGGLARLAKGDGWDFQRLARLPNHEQLAFSSIGVSSPGFQVKHHAVVEIKYLLDGAPKEYTLTMGMRVSVASVRFRRDFRATIIN